VDEFGFTAAPT